MLKKFTAIIILIVTMLSCIPVMAADEPVIYKETIVVTENGGRFQVGFVSLEFKKEFINEDRLPESFEVIVSVKDGKAGIEINPSTPDFIRSVHIRVDSYNGLLYDQTSGKFVNVDIKKQQIIARHFSRYAFS